MKKFGRTALLLSAALVAVNLIPAGVSLANSAQTSWSGRYASGAYVMDENCPVIVEEENLTFEVPSFPSNYYESYGELLSDASTVTAEYHLYNPAGYDVEVNLAFPFGKLPDYYLAFDASALDPATDPGYAIQVDGEEVQRTLRHTYSSLWSDYDNEEDKSRLRESFLSEGLFSYSSPVTLYSYTADLGGGSNYARATAAFADFNPLTTALLCPSDGFSYDTRTFTKSLSDGETFTVSAIGQPLKEPMEWNMDGGGCTMKVQTTILGELILSGYNKGTVSKVDWFNAVCDRIISSERVFEDGYLFYQSGSFDLDPEEELLRWYAYTVKISAGQRLVNRVKAPVYPSIVTSGRDYYTYRYYLSPATDWASFSNLNIKIVTPYNFCGGTMGEWQREGEAYVWSSPVLPEGELQFALSPHDITIDFSSGDADPVNYGLYMVAAALGGGILVIIAVVVIAAVIANKATK